VPRLRERTIRIVPFEAHVDLLGVLTLAALLLFPGLVIVRAPWTAVPFLSVAFWAVSWWLLAGSGLGRERFLTWALATFVVLASLRLLKPLGLGIPSWPVALIVGVALCRLVPFALWVVDPAPGMSLTSLRTLLIVWHDGLPVSYEPLLPLTFPPHVSGLEALAADVSMLSGLTPARAAFLVSLAGSLLFELALFALLARFFTAGVSAVTAVLSFSMSAPSGCLSSSPGSTLALSLVVGASSVFCRRTSRSSAVAAGFVLGAALSADGVGVCFLPPALGAFAWTWWKGMPIGRYGFALAACLLALAPAVLTQKSLPGMGEGSAFVEETHPVVAPSPPNRLLVAASLLGFGLSLRPRSVWAAGAVGTAGVILAVLPVWRVPISNPGRILLMVSLSFGVALLLEAVFELVRGRRTARVGLGIGLLVILAGALRPRQGGELGSGALVSGDDLEAMAWIRTHTGPLDLICNEKDTPGVWIPAIAGRAVTHPEIQGSGGGRGAGGRSCLFVYDSGKSQGGRTAFENASVALREGRDAGPSQP